jgi:hypothetical protein
MNIKKARECEGKGPFAKGKALGRQEKVNEKKQIVWERRRRKVRRGIYRPLQVIPAT